MLILVTGSAGFIGFHLVKKLLDDGHSVIGLDNLNNYYDQNLKLARLNEHGISKADIKWNKLISSSAFNNYSFIKLNLEDTDQINDLFKKNSFDSVCNLAAQAGVRYSIENPHAYLNSNMFGFLNIIEACKNFGVNNFSYASSSSVYGLNEKMPLSTSDNVDHPISLYAASKKCNELIAHTYSHLFKISTTGLRFFTVYGPWGRPDMALFLFTDAILNNKPIKLFNNGDMIRDFTYIDDIVEGISKVINNPAKGNKNWSGKNPYPNSSKAPYKVYNIGNSNPISLIDYVKALENSLNKVSQKKFLPIQPGDVKMTHADVSDLKKDFNYNPNTKIQIGINSFVDWYKKYYQIK